MYPPTYHPPIHQSLYLFFTLIFNSYRKLSLGNTWVPWSWLGRSEVSNSRWPAQNKDTVSTQWSLPKLHFLPFCKQNQSPGHMGWRSQFLPGSSICHGERLSLPWAHKVTVIGWKTRGHRVGHSQAQTLMLSKGLVSWMVHSWLMTPPVNYVTGSRLQSDHLFVLS